MAFSEFEITRYRKLGEDWGRKQFPPETFLGQVLPLFQIEDPSILFGERRPHWKNPGEWMERHFAKVTWVQKAEHWKLYWMPGSTMRWTAYPALPKVATLEDAIAAIHEDAHACFLG